jgi:demethylmenaquinone methyltransferase/2-methoxy-6-polyprenyl-1,4-benzoquinol methylase
MPSFTFVQELFSSVADHYDTMNDVMSFGLHQKWRRDFVRSFPWKEFPHTLTYLDMACGTGDVACEVIQQTSSCGRALLPLLCDPNPDMLAKAKKKLPDPQIQWIEAAAESVPLEDNSIDLYTIAFGIRNVSCRKRALEEAYRLLRPGGFFFCLEFSMPLHPALKLIYQPYLRFGLPLLGHLIAKNTEAYRYLGDSIEAFPGPLLLEAELLQANFQKKGHILFSKGIVAVHWAEK